MGHVLMESWNGLTVGTHLTQANGTAEREAALTMVHEEEFAAGAMLGADKADNAWRFKQALRDRNVVLHMALRSDSGLGGAKFIATTTASSTGLGTRCLLGFVRCVSSNASSRLYPIKGGRGRLATTLWIVRYSITIIAIDSTEESPP